jgi:hypothetical protein
MGSFDTKKCLTCDRLRAEVEKYRGALKLCRENCDHDDMNPCANCQRIDEALAPPEEK